MPINVYPWPPVGAVGAEWTEDAPVARLRSALTGRDQMQASQRQRRIATVVVSALAAGRMGAGYSEMLKKFLAGGIHAVRLKSSPINWFLDEIQRRGSPLSGQPLFWRADNQPMTWQSGGRPFAWFTVSAQTGGAVISLGGGVWQYQVDGLPANTLVARPGDFIRLYDQLDQSVSEVARVVGPARTDEHGTVWFRLDREPSISGARVNVAGQDEGVFRVDGALPRAIQTISGDWTYSWSFREVFADEVGGFVERPNTWT